MSQLFVVCRSALIASLLFPLQACVTAEVKPCVDAPVQPKAILDGAVVQSALAAPADKQYADRVAFLKTNWENHEIVLNPEGLIGKLEGSARHPHLDVQSPFYLLAVEKPRTERAVPEHSCRTRDYAFDELRVLNEPAYSSACGKLDDPHSMVPTHVARFDSIASGVYQKPCFLFNTYHNQFACADAPAPDHAPSADPHADGIQAIDALRLDLSKRLTGVTHIVIMSTGWNTHQGESLYNYLDWAQLLMDQKPVGVSFNPVFIGISWQSQFDYVPTQASVVTKGNDADEVGLRWANRLVNDAVMPLAEVNRIPVVLIGHSYGTRVLGAAIYRRDAISRATLPSSPLAFLALQPAFTINRFDKNREAIFETTRQHIPNTLVAMTSSPYDGANTVVGSLGWGDHRVMNVGGGYALDQVKNAIASPLISFTSVDEAGKINGAQMHRPGLFLVDASAIVNCTLPNTGPGGGAHDDVFTKQMGVFFWQAIVAASKN